MDRIKKELPAEREELSRERIELQDGKMCDLVAYDVKAYGYVEYAENIEQSNGDFRRTRSLIPFNYLDANMNKFRWDIYGVDVKLQQGIAKSFVEQFKKYQKMNFLDCLTELRINAAKELLADPFRSAAEVASMVGYEDASYFARAFKKRTGMTPTQYRKEAAKTAREARL